MQRLRDNRREEQDRIFLILKGLALFFCTYPLFELFFEDPSASSITELNMQTLVTSFVLILIVLFVWLLLTARKSASKLLGWLEIGMFYIICLISVVASGGYQSSYKFLFIYMVVAYTIQLGRAAGFAITGLVSATLFILDVVTFSGTGVNKAIQSDMALSFFFFMVTYIIGSYANTEKKYIKELTSLVNVDGLTGLYNHRFFFDTIGHVFDESKRSGATLSMAMFDLDYFKQYNDIFGHQMGDSVLKDVSACMTAQLREGDRLFRYGGEEFALIMSDTPIKEAQELCENIRIAVLDLPVKNEHLITGGRLTVSAGVTNMLPGDMSANDMVARADSALYRAKYLRKNRVETYIDVLSQFQGMDDTKREALISAKALINVVNIRDSYTYNHTERVVYNCELMAEAFGLSDEDRSTLILSASLHDLGKINISKDILIAEHSLSDEEWEIIRRHPETSSNIVGKIEGLETVALIINQHHERYDGEGYPNGLKGEEIHPFARILALADSFDAMTNDRPYKKAKTYANALKEIRANKGHQFDPEMTEVFITTIENVIKEQEFSSV